MRISAFVFALSAGLAAVAGGLDDACISFSTKGPDRYADGSTVIDGECYALVWSADGVFEGFTASGECVDTNDLKVLVAPIAKDARCPPVLFQVSAAMADKLSGGSYSVYLLDTRVASSGAVKPCGTVNGKTVLVNGYGAVSADLVVGGARSSVRAAEFGSGGASGQIASSLSRVPDDCVQPKIKNIRIDGENVYLTVENLKGYMRVHGGGDVRASETTGAAVETSGQSSETILVAPKGAERGFYRVVRNK